MTDKNTADPFDPAPTDPAPTERAPHQQPDAEAMSDPRVRKLIEMYAALVGAQLTRLAPDLIELEVPPDEQAFFVADGASEAPSRVRLAFSLHALEHDPDAEMAVLGSAVLEHVFEAIRTRGCRAYHGTLAGADLGAEAAAELEIPTKRCTVSDSVREVKLHRVGTLLVRAVLRSGAEVEERIVRSGVFDLATGSPVPKETATLCLREGTADADQTVQESDDAYNTVPSLPMEKLVERALGDIETQLGPAIAEYSQNAAESLAAELTRLDRYYGRLIDEDQNLTSDRAATVMAERGRRATEEYRRYELRAFVFPIQLEDWAVPVERTSWSLRSEFGKEAEATSMRYLAGDSAWILTCPHCGKEPEALSVCQSGHAVCESCALICSVCGEDFCEEHGVEKCFVDQKPACREHSAKCRACGRQHCSDHQGTCEDGDHEVCTECLISCGSCGRSTCAEHGTQTAADAPRGSRWLCSQCVVFCEGGTNEPVGIDEVAECDSCERYVCERHQAVCVVDGKVHCSRHLRRTDHSRRLVCEKHRATCDLEPGAILATDEVTNCSLCGKNVCERHAGICDVHNERFCLEHLKPLLDTQGDMGCEEHHSVCHVDGGTYSLSGTSPCPVCDKPTCPSHLVQCEFCGRVVCRNDGSRGQPCVTCRKLEETYDVGDDIFAASITANDNQPMKVKGWRLARDAQHKVVEADLGWTRKVVFTVRHGDSKADTVVKHSMMGSRVVR